MKTCFTLKVTVHFNSALFFKLNNVDCNCRIMAQFHFNNDELEYVVDGFYDAADFDDDPFGEVESPRANNFDGVDTDFEDDFEAVSLLNYD